MGKWVNRLKKDPANWLLEKSCPPIKLRTLTEILGKPPSDPDVAAARQEACNYKPATTISTDQSDDGTWFHSLVGFENRNAPRKRGPGTTSQILALTEFGWGNDHPIVWRSIELYRALLYGATNVDLYELRGICGGSGVVESWARRMLARTALAVLVRVGFAEDVAVRQKTTELLKDLEQFYIGDVRSKLLIGQHTRQVEGENKVLVDEVCDVVAPDAPAPNHNLWLVLAWSPLVRSSEKGRAVALKVAEYMFSEPPPPHPVVKINERVLDQDSDFLLRTLDGPGFASEKRVGRLLQELELLARAGILESVPKAVEALEWLLQNQDEEGILRLEDHLFKVLHPVDYTYFPLEDNWRGKHKKFTDTTFRLRLILHLLDS